jgi:hypothetical protein
MKHERGILPEKARRVRPQDDVVGVTSRRKLATKSIDLCFYVTALHRALSVVPDA